MKRHVEFQNQVAVYDSLSLSQRQELDEHLQTCQGCASDLAAYRQMDADIRSLRDERAGAQVRVRFADDLYARLTQERRPAGYTRLVSTPARRFAAGLAALCLIVATVLLAAPGARATVGQLIRTIGGITFDFTTPPPDSSGATIIPERVVSLAEARATLPFELRLPAWAPEGFVLQEDQVRIWLHTSGTERQTVSFTWLDPAHPQSIHMYIDIDRPASSWGQWLVGSEKSVEEVVINGQPGALVRGGWEDGQWGAEPAITLLWQPEGAEATYMLVAWTQFMQLTQEDLIRMAESVR